MLWTDSTASAETRGKELDAGDIAQLQEIHDRNKAGQIGALAAFAMQSQAHLVKDRDFQIEFKRNAERKKKKDEEAQAKFLASVPPPCRDAMEADDKYRASNIVDQLAQANALANAGVNDHACQILKDIAGHSEGLRARFGRPCCFTANA